jgi:thioredoxin reductase
MDTARPTDPCAIDGKFAPADEHAQLLVVGAGPAGLAAAIEAAARGVGVVLVDENPVPAALMGLDVPLFYGQRMNPAVQEGARMVERIVAATPAIATAFDAGVDVRLGVTVWGTFANGAALNALPARVAGLADGTKSWLCGFDALILATGARDLVLGFEGIDQPGVMGARALHSLLTRYDAFDGNRLVILGSGDLAAETALAARQRGLEIAALIETLPEPQAAPHLLQALAADGITIRTGTTILRAESNTSGVTAAILTAVGSNAPQRLECDTICLAIGAVPAIELAGVLGCRLTFRGDRGGHVPVLSGQVATSIPGVFCAGDCAGLTGEEASAAQGRDAARQAAAWLQIPTQTPAEISTAPLPTSIDTTPYRLAWMRGLLQTGGLQAPVCLCEEVNRAELLAIRPPRYLGCTSNKIAARDSNTLLKDGPLNPDQIKRLTRAGMGPCQGRRCREQIALLLADASDTAPAAIPLASYRAPVRPLPLSLLGNAASMQEGWDVWFGIRTQWIPYDAIGTAEETRLLDEGAGGNMHA